MKRLIFLVVMLVLLVGWFIINTHQNQVGIEKSLPDKEMIRNTPGGDM